MSPPGRPKGEYRSAKHEGRSISPRRDDPWPSGVAASDGSLHETRLSGAQVYAGKLLDVRRDRVRLPDGSEGVREYIAHPGAVLAIPELDDGRLLVERQFRYPLDLVFVEFPAGKLDPGEAPLAAARRELIEEVGYAAVQWTRLGAVHPAISYSTEVIDLYVAQGLTHVGSRLDPGEFLEVVTRSVDELHAALDAGELTDAKTIAALALYARWRAAPSRSCSMSIRGRVQGVGYRDWLVTEARRAGVSGWVRNHQDGTVEAHVQGARVACDRLITGCRQGPRSARVDTIAVERVPFVAGLSDFAWQPAD